VDRLWLSGSVCKRACVRACVEDLLLLQSVIRTPANTDVDILVRQATVGSMRETLKEIDKRGFANIFVHLSAHDTHRLLRAVRSATARAL